MKNNTQDMQIADTPAKIAAFQMLALKGALKLECLGMKRRGESVVSIVKARYGFKGNKESIYKQYCTYLRGIGVLID